MYGLPKHYEITRRHHVSIYKSFTAGLQGSKQFLWIDNTFLGPASSPICLKWQHANGQTKNKQKQAAARCKLIIEELETVAELSFESDAGGGGDTAEEEEEADENLRRLTERYSELTDVMMEWGVEVSNTVSVMKKKILEEGESEREN